MKRSWIVLASACAVAAVLLGLGLSSYATDKPPPTRVPGYGTPAPAGALPPASAGSALQRAPVKVAPGGIDAAVAANRPELTSQANLVVAGKYNVDWAKPVVLSDADASSAANGVCQIAIAHVIRNAGSAASGGFVRLWRNVTQKGVLEDATPSIAAGATLARTDTLSLKPGLNNLVLYLDYYDEIKEKEEGNNQRGLSITLNGKCGGVPVDSNARGGAGGLRWAPESNANAASPSPTRKSSTAPGSALPAMPR